MWKFFTFVIFIWTLMFSAASAVEQIQRPVLFVPGILGSKLCEGEQVVWGTALSILQFAKLKRPIDGKDQIKPCGLVEKVDLLGPFWSVHQYDSVLSALKGFGYAENTSLFILPYDWRQSNFDSAKALQAFVEATPQLRNGNFDVVAHSMGGLITRIYVRDLGGASKVNKIVFLGTPFAGAMNALATLSDGWGGFANRLAGGIDVIRDTVLSFPSMYELFPSYDACCRLGSEVSFTALDIYSLDVWRRYGWLPQQYRTGPEAGMVKANLERAAKLRDLMREPLSTPQHVRVAGDAFATRYYLYVSKDDPRWQNWRFSKSRGDGTVPVWSAANNFKSLSGTVPSFSEHATIFDDQTIRSILSRELITNLPPPVDADDGVIKVSTNTGDKSVKLVDADFATKIVEPGSEVRLAIALDFAEPITRGSFSVEAKIISPSGEVAMQLSETTTDADLLTDRISFAGTGKAPADEGAWRVNLIIPGQPPHALYFATSKLR